MSKRNVMQRAVDEFFGSAGFEKNSGSWYRREPRTIVIVNLQKSQYTLSYFLNLSIWLTRIEDLAYPKPHQSHIMTRFDSVLSSSVNEELNRLLAVSEELNEVAHSNALRAVLDRLLPVLGDVGSLDWLKSEAGLAFRGKVRVMPGVCEALA